MTPTKKKRGSNQKSSQTPSQPLGGGPTKAQLDVIRSKGIFSEAHKGERFGPHPGQVDLTIRISVYNSITQREEKLPGKEIGLLISSIEEVDTMMRVIEEVLTDWSKGLYLPRR